MTSAAAASPALKTAFLAQVEFAHVHLKLRLI